MKTGLIALLILGFSGIASAKQGDTPNPRVISQEDGVTQIDQSKKPADILVTKEIRSELMKDSMLSMKAKNIRIMTFNNGVTLKGEVKSEDERERILKHAYITAPKHKIYNQISVVK